MKRLMNNLNKDFDKYFFRPLDIIRIRLKKVFTILQLRNKQSCKYCGRDQSIIWTIKDEYWYTIPKRYHNKCLCLECFCRLYPDNIDISDFELIKFIKNGE
jgi:hypothetical protein